jgi:hypothetical protein
MQQHLKCKRHIDLLNIANKPTPGRHTCNACGKKYYHRQSLHVHKKSCNVVAEPTPPSADEIIEGLKNTVLEERKLHQSERDQYLKEYNELRAQIAMLLDKHAGTTNTTTNSNNNNTSNTNIETQNINIIINAFGNENTDYLDDKAILACIGRVYNSIPSLLEKIHFDPKHPENHNIKITNRKLPYASVMGNNQKWKTVDRKDAIDTMVNNSYNILDDKFKENKDKIPASTQQHFRGFQSKFDTEDKELMKEIKAEVDIMVLNGI